MSDKVDRRHGDPEHGGLSTGEKAAISRAVHGSGEVHFTEKHPEKAKAAEEYRHEVEAKETKGHHEERHHKETKGHPEEHHMAGELTQGEKAAVTRQIRAGKAVDQLPFVQGHPKKLQRAQEYAAEAEAKG